MKKKLTKVYNGIKIFAEKSYEDSLPAYAAQTAFFTLMSFFPFIMLLLIIVNNMSLVRSNIAGYIIDVVPAELKEYVLYIVDDVFYSERYSFTIITALVSIWSSAKGIQALTYGLNKIYRTDRKNNFFFSRLISALYTIVLMILCIVIMIVYMFGTQIAKKIIEINPTLEKGTILVFSLKNAFTFMVFLVMLQLIYFQLPGRHGKFRHELPGAFLGSVGFLIIAKGFTLYMKYFASKSYMYGSLTSIILLMLWLYICMSLILSGAQINFYFQKYYVTAHEVENKSNKGTVIDTQQAT